MMMNKSVWLWMAAAAMLVAVNEAAEYSIAKFGAKPDGKSDATQAIMKAFQAACNDTMESKVHIPAGKYAVGPVNMQGPCKAPVSVQATGATFLAPTDANALKSQHGWIVIQFIDHFYLHGGTFDGQGQHTWKTNNWKGKKCLAAGKCPPIPINMNFHAVNNSIIQDITSKDSKNFHINCVSSSNVTFERVTISAPDESPNTDGIHIARGSSIKVLDSTIGTGDDCISMGDELTNVLIKSVKCGPGHGISIGSLGKVPNEKDVTGVTITGCTFTGTSNGVRIKTWPSAPGTIKVTDINYLDLTMVNASNPVIIDQQYCPWNLCSLDKPSLIQISKVKIANIKGTSATQDVLIFSCSKAKPCQDVQIGNVDLKFTGDPKLGGATTKCENLKYTASGKQNPPLCAKSAAPTPRPGAGAAAAAGAANAKGPKPKKEKEKAKAKAKA